MVAAPKTDRPTIEQPQAIHAATVFNFQRQKGHPLEIIRADKISRPTVITADIIRLVQEAELCVVDLTGNNPNVFYECGRRHESGKPFIQLISKAASDKLPFDVAGIRTITYDLSSPREVLASQTLLKEYVQQLVDAGFKTATSGESLTSIAQGIERVEKKVTQILSLASPTTPTALSTSKYDSIEMAMKPPQLQFRHAIEQGRLDLAFQVLPRLRKAAGYTEYIGALGVIASIGDEKAFTMLETELDGILDSKANESQRQLVRPVIEVLQNYFGNTGKAADGVAYMKKLLERVVAADDFTAEVKGFLANKVGMLAWLIDDHATCVRFTKMAIDFCPKEPSYHYNLALVYKETRETNLLLATLSALAECSELDSQHLQLLSEFGVSPKSEPRTEVKAGG